MILHFLPPMPEIEYDKLSFETLQFFNIVWLVVSSHFLPLGHSDRLNSNRPRQCVRIQVTTNWTHRVEILCNVCQSVCQKDHDSRITIRILPILAQL